MFTVGDDIKDGNTLNWARNSHRLQSSKRRKIVMETKRHETEESKKKKA